MAIRPIDTEESFDSVLASTLFPSAVRLAQLAVQTHHSSSNTGDAGTAGATQEELSAKAASLRSNLAVLADQASNLPAGQLSLEDQDWLIEQLESRVHESRQALVKMAELTKLEAVATSETVDAKAQIVAAASAAAEGRSENDQMDMAA
ncbi:hypothetical protein JCM10908_002941 [Rhodotorula pacifica]|uniref:uncharacterized protein n=1 Tax=Rhodotorula pacifica TaxID=1495444 RepID=UPI0031776BA0